MQTAEEQVGRQPPGLSPRTPTQGWPGGWFQRWLGGGLPSRPGWLHHLQSPLHTPGGRPGTEEVAVGQVRWLSWFALRGPRRSLGVPPRDISSSPAPFPGKAWGGRVSGWTRTGGGEPGDRGWLSPCPQQPRCSLASLSPLNPTDQAKHRQLGFELSLLFCKCEFYKALYN